MDSQKNRMYYLLRFIIHYFKTKAFIYYLSRSHRPQNLLFNMISSHKSIGDCCFEQQKKKTLPCSVCVAVISISLKCVALKSDKKLHIFLIVFLLSSLAVYSIRMGCGAVVLLHCTLYLCKSHTTDLQFELITY